MISADFLRNRLVEVSGFLLVHNQIFTFPTDSISSYIMNGLHKNLKQFSWFSVLKGAMSSKPALAHLIKITE